MPQFSRIVQRTIMLQFNVRNKNSFSVYSYKLFILRSAFAKKELFSYPFTHESFLDIS